LDIQKAWEKAVHIAVNAVGDGRAVAHQSVAIAGGDPQIGVGHRQIAHGLPPSVQTAAGDAQQVQRVAGGLEVAPLLLGFPGIDAHDQELLLAQAPHKVLGIGRVILSAKEHMLRADPSLFG
jgi:hypothetical protein